MKIETVLFLLLFVLSSGFCKGDCSVVSNKKACRLSMQMNQYFLETLKNSFHLEEKAELFEKFLDSYIEERKKISATRDTTFKSINLDLKLDVQKLKKINNRLFERNLYSYYYFFPEVHYKKGNPPAIGNVDSINNAHKNNCKSGWDIFIVSTSNIKIDPNIHILAHSKFHKDIMSLDLKTTSFISNSIEEYGAVNYFHISEFIINEAKEELTNPALQEILSIIFWKHICIEAGIDFYVPSR